MILNQFSKQKSLLFKRNKNIFRLVRDYCSNNFILKQRSFNQQRFFYCTSLLSVTRQTSLRTPIFQNGASYFSTDTQITSDIPPSTTEITETSTPTTSITNTETESNLNDNEETKDIQNDIDKNPTDNIDNDNHNDNTTALSSPPDIDKTDITEQEPDNINISSETHTNTFDTASTHTHNDFEDATDIFAKEEDKPTNNKIENKLDSVFWRKQLKELIAMMEFEKIDYFISKLKENIERGEKRSKIPNFFQSSLLMHSTKLGNKQLFDKISSITKKYDFTLSELRLIEAYRNLNDFSKMREIFHSKQRNVLYDNNDLNMLKVYCYSMKYIGSPDEIIKEFFLIFDPIINDLKNSDQKEQQQDEQHLQNTDKALHADKIRTALLSYNINAVLYSLLVRNFNMHAKDFLNKLENRSFKIKINSLYGQFICRGRYSVCFMFLKLIKSSSYQLHYKKYEAFVLRRIRDMKYQTTESLEQLISAAGCAVKSGILIRMTFISNIANDLLENDRINDFKHLLYKINYIGCTKTAQRKFFNALLNSISQKSSKYIFDIWNGLIAFTKPDEDIRAILLAKNLIWKVVEDKNCSKSLLEYLKNGNYVESVDIKKEIGIGNVENASNQSQMLQQQQLYQQQQTQQQAQQQQRPLQQQQYNYTNWNQQQAENMNLQTPHQRSYADMNNNNHQQQAAPQFTQQPPQQWNQYNQTDNADNSTSQFQQQGYLNNFDAGVKQQSETMNSNSFQQPPQQQHQPDFQMPLQQQAPLNAGEQFYNNHYPNGNEQQQPQQNQPNYSNTMNYNMNHQPQQQQFYGASNPMSPSEIPQPQTPQSQAPQPQQPWQFSNTSDF